MIPCLDPRTPAFPPVSHALRDPQGLLAAGGALSPDWLLTAYPRGIFPWFSTGDPILWWSPDPRMVLEPGQERISRSLRRRLRQQDYTVRCDTAFAEVIAACAAPRSYARSTWIVDEMQAAYCALHELGWAHSVEIWIDGRLAGGLYGLAIGRAFFGESMFHRAPDASKMAFMHLMRVLARENFALLDCQLPTPHLASLGGQEMARDELVRRLTGLTQTRRPGRWAATLAEGDWSA